MPQENLKGLRVLVVDDSLDAAESLALLLRDEGAEVRIERDGSGALIALRDWDPSAALLDIAMPGIDGYEIARRARADVRTCNILLVAISGWANDDDRRRSHQAGFDHHLMKPVASTKLFNILATAHPAAGILRGASRLPPASPR
jgi:CheY-like chemotaxis protein